MSANRLPASSRDEINTQIAGEVSAAVGQVLRVYLNQKKGEHEIPPSVLAQGVIIGLAQEIATIAVSSAKVTGHTIEIAEIAVLRKSIQRLVLNYYEQKDESESE